jgi:hypothetical protein
LASSCRRCPLADYGIRLLALPNRADNLKSTPQQPLTEPVLFPPEQPIDFSPTMRIKPLFS